LSIWVVINPHAAAFAHDPGLVEAVGRRARSRAKVRVTESLAELRTLAKEAASKRASRVVLCGGDGTYMAGVTALCEAFRGEALPELVLAPAGTVATVARSFGQGRDLLSTIGRATDEATHSEIYTSATVSVTDDAGEARVGFIFGTGLVARFFQRYYREEALGYAAAARIVARVLVGSFVSDAYSRSILEPLPCRLTVNGQKLAASSFSLVLCSVVRDVGLHLWVCHRAGEDASRPHLVASSLPPRKLGPQVFRVLLGRGLADAEGFDDLVSELRLDFPESGPYVLDGDLFHAKSVEVRAGPRITIRSYR
jgi:diacylglycerol kinase family enzyme